MRVLVVEDDLRIASDLNAALTGAGFLVESCADGKEAWFLGGTEGYALIILDLGLPGMDGLSVLRNWRSDGNQVPVLVLTARGAWTERVEGIDAGADDYLAKPFRMEEVVARARALVRRAAGQASAILVAGDLTLDTRAQRLAKKGQAVSVSRLEYRLIAYLMHHRQRSVSSAELLEHLYGDDSREPNALEALVARVRRKLGSESITTQRGFGYRITS